MFLEVRGKFGCRRCGGATKIGATEALFLTEPRHVSSAWQFCDQTVTSFQRSPRKCSAQLRADSSSIGYLAWPAWSCKGLGQCAKITIGSMLDSVLSFWFARLRASVTSSLAEVEVVLLSEGRALSTTACNTIQQKYVQYREAYNSLALRAVELQQLRWHVRPKMHMYEHNVLDFLPRSWRYTSNFLDEDFIRRTKKIAAIASPAHVSRHVLTRYALAACLRWANGRLD